MLRLGAAVLICAALVAMPQTLAADDRADDRDRRRAALLFLEAAAGDGLIRSLAEPPIRSLLAATRELQPDLSGPELMVLSALYYEEMHRAARAALGQRASALAARYSLAEIEALRRFSQTEDGAAALAQQDALTGDLARKIEDAMVARMDAAFERHGRGN